MRTGLPGYFSWASDTPGVAVSATASNAAIALHENFMAVSSLRPDFPPAHFAPPLTNLQPQ
jgi:hypothetical protein